jgi:hypothetical protein
VSSPLDRIREKAEMGPATVSASAPVPAHASGSRLGMDVDELLRARRGAPVDLTGLRVAAIVSGVLGLVVAITHRWTLGWAAGHGADGGLFVFDWMVSILTFWQVHRWGPILAAVVAAGVVVLAITTDGFERGRTVESVGTSVAIGAGVTLSTPMAIVAILGVATLVVMAVLAALLVAAAGMLLWQLAASAFE